MNPSLIALSEELQCQQNLETFWTRINSALADYGVNGILYGALSTRHNVDLKKPTQAFFHKSSYPKIFFDTFPDDEILDNDASVEHCFDSTDVFFWHDDRLQGLLSKEYLDRVMIERSIGLHVGVTIPITSPIRGPYGGIGLNMPNVPLKEFSRYWAEKGREIRTICSLLEIGIQERHMQQLVGLSARERDVLTWLTAGLRTAQIADRLGISDKSVEKYIASARLKLRASTRDQAVATALIFGLIRP